MVSFCHNVTLFFDCLKAYNYKYFFAFAYRRKGRACLIIWATVAVSHNINDRCQMIASYSIEIDEAQLNLFLRYFGLSIMLSGEGKRHGPRLAEGIATQY